MQEYNIKKALNVHSAHLEKFSLNYSQYLVARAGVIRHVYPQQIEYFLL